MKKFSKMFISKNIRKNENNKILVIDPLTTNTENKKYNNVKLFDFDFDLLDLIFDNENLIINYTFENNEKLIIIDLYINDILYYSFELNSSKTFDLKRFIFELFINRIKDKSNLGLIYLIENENTQKLNYLLGSF